MITKCKGQLYFDSQFSCKYLTMILTAWFFCLPTYIFFDRYFIVLANTSAFTLKLSSLAWLLFTWHSFVSWVTRTRLGTIAIALRLGQMAGNSSGRVHHAASAIATGKSGIATMVSSFNETWHYFSLVGIGRSWNSEWLEEYGRNNRIQMLGCAYQTFAANVMILRAFFYCFICVCVRWDTAAVYIYTNFLYVVMRNASTFSNTFSMIGWNSCGFH